MMSETVGVLAEPRIIRSSIVPAAVGLDATKSRYVAYRYCAYGEEPDPGPYVRSLMEFGVQHELEAVGHVEEVTGELFFCTGDDQRQHTKGRFSCHPDGDNLVDALVEVKCRAPRLEAYEVGDQNWEKHMAQVQTQLWITGRPYCYFCCYCVEEDRQSYVWRVRSCPKYQDKLFGLLEKFVAFVDGQKPCPKRLGRRPKMPMVPHELVDGEWTNPDILPF